MFGVFSVVATSVDAVIDLMNGAELKGKTICDRPAWYESDPEPTSEPAPEPTSEHASLKPVAPTPSSPEPSTGFIAANAATLEEDDENGASELLVEPEKNLHSPASVHFETIPPPPPFPMPAMGDIYANAATPEEHCGESVNETAPAAVASYVLYVCSQSRRTTETILRECFAASYNTTSTHILKDKQTGRSRKRAHVALETSEIDGDRAIEATICAMHGRRLDGETIRVELALRCQSSPKSTLALATMDG